MNKENIDSKNREISRRSALAATSLAVAGLLSPKVAKADTGNITKNDAGKLSFQIANQKNASDRYERTKNKVTVIDETASDDTYVSAKAVYDYIKYKQGYTVDEAVPGQALFVDSEGNCALQDYTVDEEFKNNSKNPVQGKVIFEQVDKIKKRVTLDEVPTEEEETEEEETEEEGSESSTEDDKIKHVCKSNGYWVTYQEEQECPEHFTECKMGINYTHEGSVISTQNQTWVINKVDDTFMALCEDEFGGIFFNNTKNVENEKGEKGLTWEPPLAIWHT